MKILIAFLAIFLLLGISQASERWVLEPLPVDSSGAANGGSVLNAGSGLCEMRLSTLAATADSSSMTFRFGPILTEGWTAMLGWFRVSTYADSGTVANDTAIARLFTSYDMSYSTLALTAIDSNKFTDTGTWFMNIDNDTIFKKWTYIDLQIISPDNLETDSTDYGKFIRLRGHGEAIKQKGE